MDPSYPSFSRPNRDFRNAVSNANIEYKKEQKNIFNELTSRVHDYLLGNKEIAFFMTDAFDLKAAYDEAVNQINIDQCKKNDSSYQFFGGNKWDNSTLNALPKEIVFHIIDLKSCSHILDIKPPLSSFESFKVEVFKKGCQNLQF